MACPNPTRSSHRQMARKHPSLRSRPSGRPKRSSRRTRPWRRRHRTRQNDEPSTKSPSRTGPYTHCPARRRGRWRTRNRTRTRRPRSKERQLHPRPGLSSKPSQITHRGSRVRLRSASRLRSRPRTLARLQSRPPRLLLARGPSWKASSRGPTVRILRRATISSGTFLMRDRPTAASMQTLTASRNRSPKRKRLGRRVLRRATSQALQPAVEPTRRRPRSGSRCSLRQRPVSRLVRQAPRPRHERRRRLVASSTA